MSSALYLSIPFCRAKCSFCNFASGPHSAAQQEKYLALLARHIGRAPELAAAHEATFARELDSIYFGGGTPSLLEAEAIDRLFAAIRQTFRIAANAEITVEVAPTTLDDEALAAWRANGVNRVSLGVQSFAEREARAVGRRHNAASIARDMARLRAVGIDEISIDLIAGLPYQTRESWQRSLTALVASDAPHASIYMLEVDRDSRLGRELLDGGTRYHAGDVPNDDIIVAGYEQACATLASAGLAQYEISNFARPGHASRHNLRYWQRLPYFGFGLEAHSMLATPMAQAPHRAVRLAFADELDAFLADTAPQPTLVDEGAALEETFFLGLRMNCGLELTAVARAFGEAALAGYRDTIAKLVDRGLVELANGWLRLTARGRLFSNDVFVEFLRDDALLN